MDAKPLTILVALATLSLMDQTATAGEKAKIDRAAAEKIALARIPGGKIKEGELETEHGKLVWSFDIAQDSSADIIEVQVEANTGDIVAVETESAADEKKESDDKDKGKR